MRTSNPTLSDKVFRSIPAVGTNTAGVMTIEGSVNKTFIALGITIISAWWSWNYLLANPTFTALMIPAVIVAFIISLVICFKRNWAPILTPVYAVTEGLVLGILSAYFESQFPGIVVQAISLTMGTLFALLMAYKSKLIPVTDNFRLGIVAATGGIALVYFASIILSFFGIQMSFLHSSSLLSIGISGVIVVIAALNLVLDFDFIERGAQSHSLPKYMEWYAAFGLLVTLVWLYVEVLRLLSKIQSRNR